MSSLVSIIMPVFNAEKYVSEAINSVLAQTHAAWELLIINDGSRDRSKEMIQRYDDPRIMYFEQDNKGVSSARNIGLQQMTGDYFCFLDSDDCLTENSLALRLELLRERDELSFVDGAVSVVNHLMQKELHKWIPSFKGEPLKDLVRLTGNSFFGVTWMIRRESTIIYRFDEDLTHAEDLWFYIQLSLEARKYDFVSEVVYLRRSTEGSAMTNLDGLAKGYLMLKRLITDMGLDISLVRDYSKRVRSIMFKSYLRKGQLRKALTFIIKI